MRKVFTSVEEKSSEQNKEVSKIRFERMKEGLCPDCGEKGILVNFGPVCSKHGPYFFIDVKKIEKEREMIEKELDYIED